MKKFVIMLVLAALAVAGCGGGGGSSQPSASQQAINASRNLQSQVYQSKHDIEFRNYNLRQKVADDPSTILWCTFFPGGIQGVSNGSTGGQAFTVPVAGKLTSSAKRPYDQTRYTDAGNYAWYPREVPGPDHMFGSSAEYRYGFDPTLAVYYDFTSLPSFCTTEPTVWQAQDTNIVVNTDKTLSSLTRAAEAAIKAGNAKKAYELLKSADARQK